MRDKLRLRVDDLAVTSFESQTPAGPAPAVTPGAATVPFTEDRLCTETVCNPGAGNFLC